jgi:hypothetical protein
LIISGDLMMSMNVRYNCSSLYIIVNIIDLLVKLRPHSVNVDALAELKQRLSSWDLKNENSITTYNEYISQKLANHKHN